MKQNKNLFSRNIFSVGDYGICHWDIKNKTEVFKTDNNMICVHFSLFIEENMLLLSYDEDVDGFEENCIVAIYDVKEKKVTKNVFDELPVVWRIDYEKEDQIMILSSLGHYSRIISLEGKEKKILRYPSGVVDSTFWRPRKTVIYGGGSGIIKFYEMEKDKFLDDYNSGNLNSLDIFQNELMYTSKNHVGLLDLRTMKESHRISFDNCSLNTCRYHQNTIVCAGNGVLITDRRKPSVDIKLFEDGNTSVFSHGISFLGDDHIAFASEGYKYCSHIYDYNFNFIDGIRLDNNRSTSISEVEDDLKRNLLRNHIDPFSMEDLDERIEYLRDSENIQILKIKKIKIKVVSNVFLVSKLLLLL